MALALMQLRHWLQDRDDRGASLVEYALLLALIAVVCFVAVGVLGGITSDSIESTGQGFP